MVRYLVLLVIFELIVWGREVSYDWLVRYATMHSKTLLLHKIDSQIESAKADTVRSEYYPVLSIGANNEYNENLDRDGNGIETIGESLLSSDTRYQSSVSLNLNYELYHFGTTDRRVTIAESEAEIKRLEWCEEEQNLHRQILEHYASAYKAEREIAMQSQILEMRQESYTQKKRLCFSGKQSWIDLGEEAMGIVDLERRIETAKTRYEDEIKMLGRLSYLRLEPDNIKLLPLSQDVKKNRPIRFEESAEGVKLEEKIRQKEAEISMHIRSQFPTVSLYSNYYYYGSDPEYLNEAMEEVKQNSWKVGIGIRMNLFEGFKYNSESRQYELELLRLKEEKSLREREYGYEVEMRNTRLAHLELLEKKNLRLLDEMKEVNNMADRLREEKQIDAIAHTEKKIRTYEKRLDIEIKRIETVRERIDLRLLNRGVDQCSLR